MNFTRRSFVSALSGATLLGVVACAQQSDHREETQDQQGEPAGNEEQVEEQQQVDLDEFKGLELDMAAWKHDEENGVYYQLGVPYCLDPASKTYESLAIFVPETYLAAVDEDNPKLYEVDPTAKVGGFTAKTAPVVMPINSGTLRPQTSPTSYSYAGLANYLEAGLIYVYAGFRGRSSGYESGQDTVYPGGAPWPVVDLKAAVRFLRYNAQVLPGDLTRVFTFGFSAGGGVSAVMGASGDSALYVPYLDQIGAATHDAQGEDLSDATFGSASWCPVTSFDTADASYEWMMGQYFNEGPRADGTWTKSLSNNLARAYATYVNDLDLVDENGQRLNLDETSGELYADGSYYAYLVNCVQDSASTFFANAQFPYTYTPQHLVNANFPGDPNLQSVGAGMSDIEAVTSDASAQAAGVGKDEVTSGGATRVQSVVYSTDVDYVNDLNADASWLTLNQRHATARISSLGDFARHLKAAVKGVGAFDALDRSTVENQLFGIEDVGSLHFSQMMADQLTAGVEEYRSDKNWQDSFVRDWTEDLAEVDALETPMDMRVNMFNPLYFLSSYYEGAGTASVAAHWRINTGLFQTDTSLCTELNLALALRQCESVKDVAFTPVWGQGHVLAEVSGSAEQNLIAWVRTCCEGQ